MLETAVDRLCGFVAGAGAVEAHEDSRAICLRVRSRRHGSTSMVGTPLAKESITDCLTNLPGFGSGSRLAMTMHWQMTKVASILACCLVAEQILQACLLAFGEQPGAGVEGTASSCRTGRHLRPRRPERVAPNTPAILVEGTAGRSHDVEGTHYCHRVGQFHTGGCPETGEPVPSRQPRPRSPVLRVGGVPLLEHLLRTVLDHVQQL